MKLNQNQISNINHLYSAMKKNLFAKNHNAIIAAICIIGKECRFNPARAEYGYRRTSVKRIRQIFKGRVAKFTDEQLATLKLDNVAFFDVIYGGRNGNNRAGDGWEYRGHGYPQLTGKAAYKLLHTTPEKIVTPKESGRVVIELFNRRKPDEPYGPDTPDNWLHVFACLNMGYKVGGRKEKYAVIARATRNARNIWGDVERVLDPHHFKGVIR